MFIGRNIEKGYTKGISRAKYLGYKPSDIKKEDNVTCFITGDTHDSPAYMVKGKTEYFGEYIEYTKQIDYYDVKKEDRFSKYFYVEDLLYEERFYANSEKFDYNNVRKIRKRNYLKFKVPGLILTLLGSLLFASMVVVFFLIGGGILPHIEWIMPILGMPGAALLAPGIVCLVKAKNRKDFLLDDVNDYLEEGEDDELLAIRCTYLTCAYGAAYAWLLDETWKEMSSKLGFVSIYEKHLDALLEFKKRRDYDDYDMSEAKKKIKNENIKEARKIREALIYCISDGVFYKDKFLSYFIPCNPNAQYRNG